MRRATVWLALLLDRIKSAESGVAGRGEDHVRPFADLRECKLLAFAGIVPGAVSDAHVVVDHLDVRVNRLRAFLVTFRETMDEADVHAAEKTDRAGLRSLGREYADEIRAFLLFEDERGDVW